MTPTPALSELAPLVGTWRLVLWGGSFLPDPTERVDAGLVRFEWIGDGAVLAMRQGGDDGAPGLVQFRREVGEVAGVGSQRVLGSAALGRNHVEEQLNQRAVGIFALGGHWG